MSTPALINSDNAGNYYFGWRSDLFVGSSDTWTANNTTLRDFINSSFGQTCAVTQFADRLGFTLPNSSETIALPALGNSLNDNPTQSGTRVRFGHSAISASNSNVSAGIAQIGMTLPSGILNTIVDTNRWQYWVLNSQSLSVFNIGINGNNYNSTAYNFKHFGWLKQPLYTGSNAFLSCYYLAISNNQPSNGGGRPTLANNSTTTLLRVPTGASADSIANYSITCETSTPGANTTDLVMFDNASPNRAIGVASNLLKTSLPIPVGQIYRNTEPDPDGSNNQFWICVGIYGSERVLMRVWTQNLT